MSAGSATATVNSSSYLVGDAAVLTVSFVDSNGNPADPDTVTLTLQDPAGVQADVGSIENPQVGQDIYTLETLTQGVWIYRWAGTGAVQAVVEGSFTVKPSLFSQSPPLGGTFTYDFNANYPIAVVRLLIPDTNPAKPIFGDEEIQAFLWMESSQGIFQSGQANPTGNNIPQPVSVYSYRRAAAAAIDSIAGVKARLAVVESILDVKLTPMQAQKALHEQAEALREQEDNSGAFGIAEMVQDQFSSRERVAKVWQRLIGS